MHALGLAAVFLLATSAPAAAQLFFAAQPESGWRIGPLVLRASLGPEVGPVPVTVLFGVVPATGRPPVAQDLYLLWPGEVRHDARLGDPDRGLARAVEARGFDVVGEGRLPLAAQSQEPTQDRSGAQAIAGGAPFVTFVQTGGPLGLSPPATWIRIPWTRHLADRAWLMELTLTTSALVRPWATGWLEQLVLGPRWVLSMSFNEVRDRPLFPMYLAHRDRVVRLADAPAELAVTFSQAGRLKIDEVYPPNSIRRLSQTLESTQIVSLFLDTSEGLAPQSLSVQFGYFSRLQSVLVVLVPMLLVAFGYLAGPVLGRLALAGGLWLLARLHVGPWRGAPREIRAGTVLPREVLARIVPGETRLEDVLRLCGSEVEQHERLTQPGRRTLIYRGRRVRPQTRRLVGWVSAVRHLEVEHHQVTIEVEGEVVQDVQAEVRRSRLRVGDPL